MNNLLKRQLKKFLSESDSIPKELEPLLNAVDEAYNAFDSDRSLMEHAFELSSQEFTKINDQLEKEIEERKRTEEALRESERHLQLKLDYILSPEKSINDFSLTDLIDIRTLQEIQDSFANTTGVASIISDIEGNPITRPSNFCKVCQIIRETEIGGKRCISSDKMLGEKAKKCMKPIYQACHSCGFVDAGAPIIVGNVHIATWLIGQSNVMGVDRDRIKQYAIEIGADVDEMLNAFDEITGMDLDKFEKALDLLWRFAANLSLMGYNNLKLAKELSEREKLEDEIIKARKLESIGVLAGGIAHDFNNILTSILGNISLVKHYLKSDEMLTKMISNAEMASLRAKDLTQQLLTFSKGGAPIKQSTSIAELVRDSVSFVLKGSNVKCNFCIQDDLFPVEVDVGQINQVINNLIINADQAMPDGGIITISCENAIISGKHPLSIKAGNYVKVSVSDQGIGIPEKYLSKIFDPYFTTKEKGSGLGLATTYSIINKHDGYINVESEVGMGTTFHLYIPASVTSTKAAAHEEMNVTIKNGQGKILVMDDEMLVRNTLQELISHLGYDVLCAKDGNETLSLYKEAIKNGSPFDLVIMDLIIPGGMGGKETIKKLIEIHPEVKAIVSSGYSNDPIMANFKTYGFSGVLKKPVTINELSSTLSSI